MTEDSQPMTSREEESTLQTSKKETTKSNTSNRTTTSKSALYPPTADGQTYIPTKSNVIPVTRENVKICGRCYESEGNLAFSNTYSGIEFAFYGAALAVEFGSTSYAANLEAYATIFVDNLTPIVVKITSHKFYIVAKNLDSKKIHNVKIAKRSESNAAAMIIKTIKIPVNGRLYTAKENKTGRRIQVLGDSITCGVGNLYVSGDTTNSLAYEDGCHTYATMLADYYHAELDIVAVSGIGIGNSKNEPWPLLPLYKKEDNRSAVSYDFESFVPQVVIISLGTNDDAYGNTGDEFYANACEYIYTIRENYPGAYIIWTYGVMSQSNMNNIKKVINDLKNLGDKKLFFVPLDIPTGGELPIGMYGHPSIKSHQCIAKVLETKISELTGW